MAPNLYLIATIFNLCKWLFLYIFSFEYTRGGVVLWCGARLATVAASLTARRPAVCHPAATTLHNGTMAKNSLRDKLEGDELDLSMMSLTEVPVKEIVSWAKVRKRFLYLVWSKVSLWLAFSAVSACCARHSCVDCCLPMKLVCVRNDTCNSLSSDQLTWVSCVTKICIVKLSMIFNLMFILKQSFSHQCHSKPNIGVPAKKSS